MACHLPERSNQDRRQARKSDLERLIELEAVSVDEPVLVIAAEAAGNSLPRGVGGRGPEFAILGAMAAPTTTVDISTLLWMMPSPAGGRLCLADSGVSLRTVIWLYKLGSSPEEIQDDYKHLQLPAIYAAIAHYLANQAKLDAEWAEDDAESERYRIYYEKHGKLPGA